MARPRRNDNERRNAARVTANYTAAEYETVRLKAMQAGLRIAEYVRIQSVTGKVPAPPRTDQALVDEWNRVGVNLNQIAYKANATGRFDPTEIEATRMHLETLIQKSIEDRPDDSESGGQRQQL